MIPNPAAFRDLRDRIAEAFDFGAETVLRKSAVGVDETVFKDAGPIKILIIGADEDAQKPTLEINDLILSEEVRGCGVGTALMSTLIAFCTEEGLDLALCATPMAKPGTKEHETEMAGLIRFYERLGFENRYARWDGNYVRSALA